MKKQALEAPVFFPSASRVKIPFVGDDTRDIKLWDPNLNPLSNPLKKRQQNFDKQVLKAVSKDLTFSKDVVKERCAHALPYDRDEVLAVYDAQDILQLPVQVHTGGGRFDVRGFNRKVPGHIRKLALPRAAKLKLKARTVTERHGDEAPTSEKPTLVSGQSQDVLAKPFFLTETSLTQSPRIVPISMKNITSNKQSAAHWDEYILGKLSKDTARWIVFNNVPSGPQKDRLDTLMKKKFGDKISTTNLLREKVILLLTMCYKVPYLFD